MTAWDTIQGVAAIFGIFAIPITLWVYVKQQKYPSLFYKDSTQKILSADDRFLSDKVEVRFEHKKISQLHRTTIQIWNSGTAPIRKIDIPETNPLLITLSAQNILTGFNLTCQRKDFRVSLKENNSPEIIDGRQHNIISTIIEFEFIDPGSGFWLEILHEGSAISISIDGTIIGYPNQIRRSNEEILKYRREGINIYMGAFTMILLLFATSSREMLLFFGVDASEFFRGEVLLYILVPTFILCGFCSIWLSILIRRASPPVAGKGVYDGRG